METLVTLALISHIFIALVIIVVGIFSVVVLIELRKTLVRVNSTLDTVNEGVQKTLTSMNSLNAYAFSLQAGMRTLETVVDWVKEKKNSSSELK